MRILTLWKCQKKGLRSPLGEALVRARVGEKVNVNVPRGTLKYQIVELM